MMGDAAPADLVLMGDAAPADLVLMGDAAPADLVSRDRTHGQWALLPGRAYRYRVMIC